MFPHLHAGHGRIACASYASSSVAFTELFAAYPLKLLSPKPVQSFVAIVYVLSYGGGLVNGDHIKLNINVGDRCKLLLLSQGSTKVFKARPGDRLSTRLGQSAHSSSNVTTYVAEATVAPGGALFLLPDPVTCFRAASYSQTQRVSLSSGASLVLLDWVTSGRKSLGEEWVFSRYHSLNEVFLDGRCITRDIMLLEEPDQTKSSEITQSQGLSRTLGERLKPYSCYATVIFSGPLVQDVVARLNRLYHSTTVLKTTSPARMIWGLSPISEEKGYILRAAGVETEDVKDWLRESLRGFQDMVGTDIYLKLRGASCQRVVHLAHANNHNLALDLHTPLERRGAKLYKPGIRHQRSERTKATAKKKGIPINPA